MTKSLFDGIDPEALNRVTVMAGSLFASAVAFCVTPTFIDDDTVPPDAFSAGLAKAHLDGLAAAIVHPHTDQDQDEQLIAGAADYLRASVADLRRSI